VSTGLMTILRSGDNAQLKYWRKVCVRPRRVDRTQPVAASWRRRFQERGSAAAIWPSRAALVLVNTSSALGVTSAHTASRDAHDSASAGVLPSAMSQRAAQVVSIQAAPRVDQDQSTTRGPVSVTRMLCGVEIRVEQVVPGQQFGADSGARCAASAQRSSIRLHALPPWRTG